MDLPTVDVIKKELNDVILIKQEPPDIEDLEDDDTSIQDESCLLPVLPKIHVQEEHVLWKGKSKTNRKSACIKNPSKTDRYLHSYPNVEVIDASESQIGPFNAVFINDGLSRNPTKAITKRPISTHRFNCSYCEKTFYHNSEMIKHVRTHTGEKPFHCTYCDKQFGRKNILNAHIRIHTGERPYKCEFCDKRFKDLSNRSIHRRIHTNEKPYVCQYCDKRFYQRSNLIVHTRVHTGDRPYACNYCDRQFIQKPDLKKHIRIHTGEKPYACSHCGKTFTDKSTCRSHIKIHSYSTTTNAITIVNNSDTIDNSDITSSNSNSNNNNKNKSSDHSNRTKYEEPVSYSSINYIR